MGKTWQEVWNSYVGMEEDKAAAQQIRQEAKAAGTWGKSAEEIATIQNIGKSIIDRRNVQNKKEEAQFAKLDVDSAKIKRDRTKKEYEDYTKSDEYRKRLIETDQRNKQQEVANLFLPPEMRQAPKVIQDDKEIRLRAAMEEAEREFNAEEDRKLMEADMEAVTGLSNEDRQQLEQYAVNQIRDQNMPVEFQNMPFFKTAEQEASGLIGKIGKQRADELAETYMRQENEKFAEDVAAKGGEHAGTGFWSGVGSSLATVPINLAAGVVGSTGQLQAAARNTGRYKTLDPNATGTALQNYTGAVRGQVGQNISGDVYDEEGNLVKDGGALRGLGSLAYQGLMSAADSAARATVGGGTGGAILAAANSFSQTMADASAKGATPQQAVLLAGATAGIEALSEKIPLDRLVDTAKAGKQPIKQIIKKALQQAGIEATTEEISMIGTILAEAAILKEKSSFNRDFMGKILNGVPPEQAKAEVMKGILKEAWDTALVSMIAGAGSSVEGSAVANIGADTTLDTTSPAQKTVEEVKAETEQAAVVAENATTDKTEAVATETPAPEVKAEQPKSDVSDVVADMVRENAAKQQEQEAAKKAARERVAEDQKNRERHKEIRKELVSARAEQNRLQKEIAKAEQKLKETGKGSPARIEQLKTQLEQQNNLVAQIESQEAYFSQDYEKTVEQAKAKQQAIYEDARQKAVQAIEDHKAGKITDAQLKAANDAYNNAGAELYRLSQMTQAEYQADLAKVGLMADSGKKPTTIQPKVSTETQKTASTWDPAKAAIADRAEKIMMANEAIRQFTASDDYQYMSPADRRNRIKEITEYYIGKEPTAEKSQESTQQPQTEAQQTVQAETAPNTQQAEQSQSEPKSDYQTGTQGEDTRTDVQQRATERVTESTEGEQRGTLGKQNAPSGDIEQSKTFTNTGRKSPDADIRKGYRDTMRKDRNAANYEAKHNADTLATAQERTQTSGQAREEADYLVNKDYRVWTAEDNVTALLTIQKLTQEGGEGSAKLIASVAAQRKQANVHAGQLAQSNRIIGTMKAADNTVTAVDTFISSMENMKESETVYDSKSGKDFDTWKQDIETSVTEIGIAIESVEEGDAGGMRNVIRQIARERKTTAWFGTSDQMTPEANRILNKLDFDTLKKIANTQVAAMADDYRKRTKKEVATTLRKQSMLSSLKTIARNIYGNTVGGVADALSESGAGRLADIAMSKFTGKKTVGSDVFQTKEYARAAKEAGQFASLCVELNIPIETDVDSSFSAAAGKNSNEKYIGRTFRSTGNPAMRFLYAYQKYMSYALEVTDKVFEGGTNAAVEASLNKLKNSNLTEDDISALGDFTAQKRTFKNATWQDADGKTHGSALSRGATKIQNAAGIVGDVAAPFVSTPANVAETGIDYTAGVVRGLGDMISVIRDAKAGKEIPVERQRQAASEFGRGLTGAAMIGVFAAAAAAGALRVTNPKDWDEEALARAEGRSGAQMNWDAMLRAMKGGDGKWQTGDTVSSVDFLEPFNTQMYLGYEMAEFEKENPDATRPKKAAEYGKASVVSVINSIMDSPVMTGLQEIQDLFDDITEADGNPADIMNAAAAYGGNIASSYIPQFVRQAAQYTDGYYRDTKGRTPAETAMNSVKAAIPGLSQTLPKKYSGLGEEQKRGGFSETFIDPTETFTYEENKITTYLDDLSKRTGDASIYPSKQAPMRIDVGGETVELSPQQRETYQKTYGERVNSLYNQMISGDDFNSLTDAMKSAALNEAEAYARKTAMAAVSDYKDAPKAETEQLAADAVADTVRKAISGQFDAIDTAEKYGRSTENAENSMIEAYKVYEGLSRSAMLNVKADAEGSTAKYIEARDKGISHKDFITTAKAIANIKNPDGKDANQKQKLDTVARSGLSESQKVIMAKLYATDAQDKNIDEVNTLTQKLRQEGKKVPQGSTFDLYSQIYRDHSDYTTGNGKKSRTINHWIQKYGMDYSTAKKYYEVFS